MDQENGGKAVGYRDGAGGHMARMIFAGICFFAGSFVSRTGNASCRPSDLEICTKMSVVSQRVDEFDPMANARPFGPKGISPVKLCVTTFKDISNGKKWSLRTKKCPVIKEPAYVFIRPACNDMGGVSEDSWEIWNKDECEESPIANFARVQAIRSQIRDGITGAELRKIGFRHVGRTYFQNPSKGDSRDIFHSFPGVTLTIKMSNDSYTAPAIDVGRALEAGYLTKDFVSAKECRIWGGTPKQVEPREKSGKDFDMVTFGKPAECIFSGKPSFQRQIIEGPLATK